MFFKQINISHFKGAKHIVLLLVLVGLLAQTSANAAELKRIVVAGGDSFEPLLFLNADGEPDGIYADLWRLWSEKTGVAVELRLMAWAKTIPALLAGEVDAVDGVTYTPERAKFLDLSAPYTELPSYIYFHESIGGVRGLTDLEGFPVGVIGGSHVEDYLREKVPKLRPVPYVNYEEIVRAATEGRLRVFVGEDPIIPFMFAKMGKRITFRQTEAPIISSDMRTAVRKGDTELLALIERGHKAITSAERQQIQDEWAGVRLTSQIPWRWLIGGSAVFLAGIALLFLWNTQLQKQVAAATQTLSESEEKYRYLVERATDGIIIVQDGIVRFSNIRLAEMFGYTVDEMIDTSFLDYVFPDERSRITDIYKRRLQGKDAPDIYEMLALHKDGRRIDIEINSGIITYHGKPAILSFVRDITERKRAEEELRESEERFRFLVQTAVSVILYMSSDHRIMEFNPEAERLYGIKREDVLGEDYLELFVPEEDRDAVAADIKTVLAGQPTRGFENRVLASDGSEHVLTWNINRVLDSKGEPTGIIAVGQDITDRKRMEEELRESEEKYRELANSLPQFVFEMDEKGILTFANRNAFDFFGYTQNDFDKGFNALQLLIPEDQDRAMENIQRRLGGEELGGREYTALRKGGSTLPVVVHVNPIIRGNQPAGLRGIMIDITDRKLAEEEKKKLEAQLQQAQKMDAIGTLAGGIAHDFNNILGGIIGYTELAQSQISEGQPELARDLSEVLKASDRAKELVQQILTFSRQTDLEFKPVKMSLIVKEALKLLRASLPTTIEITLNIKSDATIWGEPTQLHQTIMNLCTNAFHAMRESGGVLGVSMEEVTLNTTELFHTNDLPPGRYIKLFVSDTGHGMDSNTLERLFDPYFTTKEVAEGTGLGLSVTHGIVKSHGGAINVESALGEGSTFTILIPVIDQDTKEDRIEEIPIPKGSERILFVDDEELFYDLVKRLLNDLGYEVVALQDSLEALKTFQARPDYFDLVITDQTMPKLTGIQLASELIKIKPGIPIILCTGFSEQVSEKTAANFGISEFVMKPVNIRKLAETIRKVGGDGPQCLDSLKEN